MPAPHIIPVEDWSTHASKYHAMRGEDGRRVNGWVAHWPADGRYLTGDWDETVAALRGYEKYHLSKGWRGLAYDYAVDMAGRIIEVRGSGRSGATAGDMDHDGISNNREMDAVLFIIGTDQDPTPEMLAAAQALADWRHGGNWAGHDEASGPGYTACPGAQVQHQIVVPLRNGQRLDAPAPAKPTSKPSTPAPAPTKPPTSEEEDIVSKLPTVRKDDTGSDVKRVQGLLVAAGHDINVDGDFGPITDRTVRAFQQAKRLTVDGIVGRNTWSALLGVSA